VVSPTISSGTHSPYPLGSAPSTLTIIFDGCCGICTRMAHWLQARDAIRRLRPLPSQQADVVRVYGLSQEQVVRELWAIDEADGHHYSGAAAVNRALQALGGGWAVLAGLYRLPPIRLLEDLGYRWFADHRAWFARWGTRPACEDAGADCTGDV
jgi:predicted DCC family thiol-disulfide oxidoreductase YuxK